MTHFERASEFYRTYQPALSPDHLTQLIGFHLKEGCIVSTPHLFALFRVREFDFGKAWWIEYLSGDMRLLVGLFPFWLPFVAFERRGVVRCYASATLINRLFANETVQDGSSDPLLRGRRGRREGETTSATKSNAGG